MKIHLQIKAVFLCGLLIHLWGANAQSCTSGATSPSADCDPHNFNLCVDGKEVLTKCPSSQSYVQYTTDLKTCQAKYGGCSETLSGCVPWEKFPWPAPSATTTAPICSSVGPVAPYSDPSNYWFCTSIYGTAQLRSCPSGYGFSTRRIFGCTIWYYWNMTEKNVTSP
ncbi:uncharacterized protein LOC119649211 [Hermetia illucens]|uniref:uncharacterized protein LOC119649211 n=1 Tax=Hermetia illucens TaxID=343691 RepID=UPI0018CC5A6D|nr:uncharacterized protein LOC119649211 [Hermetia illucens]